MSNTQVKTSPAFKLRERLQTAICSRVGKKVSGTLWPNGEFSFAYVPDDVTQVTRGEECSWAEPGPGESDEGASALDLTLLDNLPEQNPTGQLRTEPRSYGLRGMTSCQRISSSREIRETPPIVCDFDGPPCGRRSIRKEIRSQMA